MNLGETAPLPLYAKNPRRPNPEDEVFVIFFIFKFKEGYRERLLRRFEKHVVHTREEEGCLLFDLYTVEGAPDTLAVDEHWRKESDVWETELYQLGGKKIRGCTACMKCWGNKDMKCAVDNDNLNEILERMIKADAVVIGSPTYFADVSTETKALIDRAGFVGLANDGLFAGKIGAAVVAVRRGAEVNHQRLNPRASRPETRIVKPDMTDCRSGPRRRYAGGAVSVDLLNSEPLTFRRMRQPVHSRADPHPETTLP